MERWTGALLACCLSLAAGFATAQGPATVTLSADAQKRVGIATQALKTVQHASEVAAFAKVLDPAPLVQLESDYETAEAAAVASRAEAVRSKTLHDNGGSVAAKDLEAAESQARQDALKVANLHAQFDLQWGPGVAHLSEAQRRRLVAGLVKGSIALVHVDTHNNEGQAGARVVKVDVGSDSIAGAVIGPARQAEPRLQSSGLIVEISGPDAIQLSVGLTQSAHIESATSQSGVLIPRSAVVRYRGSDWAYVRVSATAFQRRLMQDPAPEDDGFFVAAGFAAGDRVVTTGAAALFAADLSRPAGAG
ncbi:MAG TPA: hypothetical protein VHW60_21440 [Caulobacteraceae bacterium]|jgi:hypothetical protein|nr:hypothetical protein [Caulobacteraceae bacterium]